VEAAAARLKRHRSPASLVPEVIAALGVAATGSCAAWIRRSSAPPPTEPRPRQLPRAASRGQDLDNALAAVDTSSSPEAAVVAVRGEPTSISGSFFLVISVLQFQYYLLVIFVA